MESKIALEKMKQLLCDISAKNESLNNDNNDLNIKIISLIKLLKSKDNQINILNKSILKSTLKNIFYKKNLAQKEKLQKAFNIFKKNTKNENDKNTNNIKLNYSKENDMILPGIKKLNCKDIGIGDFKISQRFYIRKVSCLTILKRRKKINNEEECNGNEIKINFKFKNIEQQNEVNNICIKSDRKKEKSNKNYDCSVFYLEIKHNNKVKIFDNKYLKSENIFKDYSILSNRNNNSMKLKIEQQEKDIKILEKKCEENKIIFEKINQEKKGLENKINEYNNKWNTINNIIKNKKKGIIIDDKNKFNINIISIQKKQNNEIIKINDISIISDYESKNDKEKEFTFYNNENFFILSKIKKKTILKKYNFNLNIFNNKINNNKYLVISKENSFGFFIEKKTKKEKIDIEYDLIEPMKYNIEEYKNKNNIIKYFDTLKLSNNFSINYIQQKIKKEEIIEISEVYSFEIINKIEKQEKQELIVEENNSIQLEFNEPKEKNISFEIMNLELKLRTIFFLKPKIRFFIKFIFFYFQKKLTDSFKMFRNLLINLKLKILLKNKVNGPSNFYFLKYYLSKYHSNILFISLLQNKNELLKNIEINNKLNSQITLFQETFKKYEESNIKEKKEKDTTISRQKSLIAELNKEISKSKENFEKMKSAAKDSASELITTSNESNKQKKLIEKLNGEIKLLQEEKLSHENQIKNQQDLIKNLNEKIKKDQLEYEQNEIDVNAQIEKLKVQFDEYEKSIQKLNNQNINLKKENEKLKINNENLNNNKEELISIIQESKNYEIENESLISLNKELKNNNDELNIKYKNLKKEFDNLKSMSEESKNELSKAMNEMELYSELLQTLEMKVKDAENKKINAENERDKAINDVREIRQRYINIMGEKYA